MILEWKLREELLAVAHRWPLPFLAFLLGSLIGWGFSLALPPTYRAETGLIVAFNADAIYRNPDDYKNWQLEQLNALATADDVLAETLVRLQAEEAAWADKTVEDLRGQLDLAWRNAGNWRLSAQSSDPRQAKSAARIWSEVILEKYNGAYGSAGEVQALDRELYSLNGALAQLDLRRAEITETRDKLTTWRATASAWAPEGQIPAGDHDRMWVHFSQAAGDEPAWKTALEAFPAAGSPAAAYQAWLDTAVVVADEQLNALPAQAAALNEKIQLVNAQFLEKVEESRSLSAYLSVEQHSHPNPQVTELRPASLLALVGGGLGFLAWGLVLLGRIAGRRQS